MLLLPAISGGTLLPPLQVLEVLGCRLTKSWIQLPTCLQSLSTSHTPTYERARSPSQALVSTRQQQQQQQVTQGKLAQQHARVPSGLLQQAAFLGHRGLSPPQQQLLRGYRSEVDNQERPDRRIDRYSPPGQGQHRRQQQWRQVSEQRQQHEGQKQRHPQQTNSNEPIAAALLTRRLSCAQSPGELIKLFVGHVESINHIHVIAALTRAAILWDKTGVPAAATTHLPNSNRQQHQETDVERQQLQQLLKQLLGPFTRGMPYYRGREISSGLWAYARCGQPVPEQLITAAAQQLSSWDTLSDRDATTQHLVNLSWAAITLGCRDRQLYSAIAAAAQQKLAEMTASQVSVLAWTLARAGVQEHGLMEGLAQRGRLLLEQQLQYHQQQSGGDRGSQGGKNTRIHAAQHRFGPSGLTGLSWAFGSVWKWHDAALLSAVAAVSSQVPLKYDFKPHEAANMLKGFAVAAAAADMETEYSSSMSTATSNDDSGTGSAAASDEDESAPVVVAAQPGVSVSASPSVVGTYWSSAVAVAAAVLRRQDEAQASSFVRIMWALATLQGHRQQCRRSVVAATAGPDGASVFEQTCTAVQRCWQHQPAEPQTVLLAVWALVQAQHSYLIPPLLLPGTGGSSAADHVAMKPSQELLRACCDVVVDLANQNLMKPHQLADIAAAYVKLQQHTGIDLLPIAAVTSAQRQQLQGPNFSSSSGQGQQVPQWQQERATPEQEVAIAVEQQLAHWRAETAAHVPGQQALAAAIHAIAGAAERIAAAQELRLQDAVRLLAALNKLQVQNNDTVSQKLMAQLSLERLHGCDNETLVSAARAVINLTRHQPELFKQAQQVDMLELLLGLCLDRWGAPASEGGLDDAQRSKLRRAVKQTGALFIHLPAVVQLKEVAGAL